MRATTLLTVRGASRAGVGIVMDTSVAGRTGAVPPYAAASPGRPKPRPFGALPEP
ncbi:hypothetical protein JBE27_22955 [Streptomyces albiflaviniger]|nr:hypothetical protein [Streptomyces albiflaviniger]